VSWKDVVNSTLRRTTGYQLERPRTAEEMLRRINSTERLVTSPVFLLSTVRSGSTLLRVMLNSHSHIHAPHELHLRTLRVNIERDYAKRSVELLGLDEKKLEYLLWDRVLDRELRRSRKSIIVDKTPGNAWAWKRLRECWPKARYVFLLRHPLAVAQSLDKAMPDRGFDENVREVASYGNGVESARQALSGFTLRYEDLVQEPERWLRDLCRFLDVTYEPGMLDYGNTDHGPFEFGIGDWSDKLRSGQIQPVTSPSADDRIPSALSELASAWGYAH
jgi:Sulfotransferase family